MADGSARSGAYYFTFEEYRYDALGRRVWVMARKGCDFGISNASTRPCGVGSLRRTVWDGSAELYEIVRPVSSELSGDLVAFSTAEMESDTAQIRGNLGRWDTFDPYVMWGHVAYTYGHAIDKPVGVVRMNYADNPYGTTGGLLRWTEPFALVPHWNLRGAAQSGTFASDGARDRCQYYNGETRCVQIDWPDGWFPYNPVPQLSEYWFGTLLTDKRDGSGLLYRRNRYYDPSSARFTQEDPIGLAGGLNAYGFAEGDPVTYSDPYGLCPWCIPVVIGAVEVVSTLYDLFQAWRTARNPNSSRADRAIAGGAVIGGIWTPGPGSLYTGIARRAADNLASLASAARVADRGGLTRAGRALQKHAGRQGSAFPTVGGRQLNDVAQNIVDDILTSPGTTFQARRHARFGDILEVRAPDGRGLRYNAQDGSFMGFLEP